MILIKSKHKEPLLDLKTRQTVSGEQFFATKRYKHHMARLHSLVSCPANYFNELYRELLYRYAEFCQGMPLCQTRKYSAEFGLFDYAYEVSLLALTRRQGIMLPINAVAEEIAEEQEKWTFAIATAALLQHSWRVAMDREVTLYRRSGDKIGSWTALAGSLYSPKTYYCYHFKNNLDPEPRCNIMPAIISRLISTQAFCWLYSSKYLYTQWWDFLLGEVTQKNEIANIVSKAEEKIIADGFDAHENVLTETVKTSGTQAEKFIHWVQEQITQQALSINKNDSFIHKTEEGTLMCLEALSQRFQEYQIKLDKNQQTLKQKQFYKTLLNELITNNLLIKNKHSQQYQHKYYIDKWVHRSVIQVVILKKEVLALDDVEINNTIHQEAI